MTTLSHKFTCFLLHLSTSSRIGPFCFQAGSHRRRSNLTLVFLGLFIFVVVYFVTYACLLLLSTHADRHVCVFVCFLYGTVMDFFAVDKASSVKFCTEVHRRQRQGISHFCELCSPKSPKSDISASAPPSPRHSQRLTFGSRTHERKVWT